MNKEEVLEKLKSLGITERLAQESVDKYGFEITENIIFYVESCYKYDSRVKNLPKYLARCLREGYGKAGVLPVKVESRAERASRELRDRRQRKLTAEQQALKFAWQSAEAGMERLSDEERSVLHTAAVKKANFEVRKRAYEHVPPYKTILGFALTVRIEEQEFFKIGDWKKIAAWSREELVDEPFCRLPNGKPFLPDLKNETIPIQGYPDENSMSPVLEGLISNFNEGGK